MKTIILLLLTFSFIACEEQTSETTATSPSNFDNVIDDTFENKIDVNKIDIEIGDYFTSCINDNKYGHKFLVQVEDYEMTIVKYNSRKGDNCGSFISYVKATYDLIDGEPVFKESVYRYVAGEYNDATYICGQDYMLSGNEYNIDNIKCDESFEHKNVTVKNNSFNNYKLEKI